MAKQYWLFKSEPEAYSIDDLAKEPGQTCHWDGIRNYQARNTLRDKIKVGDGVLFYHSVKKPMAVVGVCEVVREGYPDHTQFDANSKYYDPKSDPDDPRWYMVDIKLVEKFLRPVTLEEIKETEALFDMFLCRKGARLSVQPVTASEWKVIRRLGKRKPE